MTSPAITVTPGTPLRDAARLMYDDRVKPLTVIDPVADRISGTLHQRGVLRVFSRPADEPAAEARCCSRILAASPPRSTAVL
ncbi:hypothetical protein GCM10009850_119160 [Nonomuraea monospora]|uniref:CBS domain-containing protein n=1 Tax=Nonomuraea monospora TaxID=568818 RepID=A0ABN3D3R5_9ACTN